MIPTALKAHLSPSQIRTTEKAVKAARSSLFHSTAASLIASAGTPRPFIDRKPLNRAVDIRRN